MFSFLCCPFFIFNVSFIKRKYCKGKCILVHCNCTFAGVIYSGVQQDHRDIDIITHATEFWEQQKYLKWFQIIKEQATFTCIIHHTIIYDSTAGSG